MTHLYYQFSPENHQEQDQVHLKNYQELISLNERESHLNERESHLNEREFLLNERESHLKEKMYQFKKEETQHETTKAFLDFLRNLLGDNFFHYHDKFLESSQNSLSFQEMSEEGKRKPIACDICRVRKKRCVGGKIGKESCEHCNQKKKDCSYLR
ncbi:hypothetical protein C2G38_2101714 [Gigaspora rosea]|uniref:Zn(2)-C6 fungal-type domain-containing protein n=1 Tax=Gigaspora rosea TaxID=44941 RepID=A0A397UQR8_9GLOM|nr:hypothetical protein C2G38_2101714 [Gigaspora rosea]